MRRLQRMSLMSCVAMAFLSLSAGLCVAADKADPEAEAMMRRAHVARSGWDASFPGFKADVRVAIDGDVVEGKVTVVGGEVKLDLPEGAAASWAAEQLESITMHRTASVKESYDVSFAD